MIFQIEQKIASDLSKRSEDRAWSCWKIRGYGVILLKEQRIGRDPIERSEEREWAYWKIRGESVIFFERSWDQSGDLVWSFAKLRKDHHCLWLNGLFIRFIVQRSRKKAVILGAEISWSCVKSASCHTSNGDFDKIAVFIAKRINRGVCCGLHVQKLFLKRFFKI